LKTLHFLAQTNLQGDQHQKLNLQNALSPFVIGATHFAKTNQRQVRIVKEFWIVTKYNSRDSLFSRQKMLDLLTVITLYHTKGMFSKLQLKLTVS